MVPGWMLLLSSENRQGLSGLRPVGAANDSVQLSFLIWLSGLSLTGSATVDASLGSCLDMADCEES